MHLILKRLNAPVALLAVCLGYAAPMVDPPAAPDPLESDDAPDRLHATELLRHASRGDAAEQARLIDLLQPELRALAQRAMAQERADHTLQPTALVHEVWLKLFATNAASFEDRHHFLAVSAQVMRQVLVDHARARQRIKRGGAWQRVELELAESHNAQGTGETALDLLALDAALHELRELAPRQAKVVELRFFGGLSIEETAAVLDLSASSVTREWRFARAWLTARLGPA